MCTKLHSTASLSLTHTHTHTHTHKRTHTHTPSPFDPLHRLIINWGCSPGPCEGVSGLSTLLSKGVGFRSPLNPLVCH